MFPAFARSRRRKSRTYRFWSRGRPPFRPNRKWLSCLGCQSMTCRRFARRSHRSASAARGQGLRARRGEELRELWISCSLVSSFLFLPVEQSDHAAFALYVGHVVDGEG